MLLLISDACVLINIEDGNLTPEVFSLPYQLATVDFMFNDELADRHGHLLNYGLTLLQQNEEIVTLTTKLLEAIYLN